MISHRSKTPDWLTKLVDHSHTVCGKPVSKYVEKCKAIRKQIWHFYAELCTGCGRFSWNSGLKLQFRLFANCEESIWRNSEKEWKQSPNLTLMCTWVTSFWVSSRVYLWIYESTCRSFCVYKLKYIWFIVYTFTMIQTLIIIDYHLLYCCRPRALGL